MMVTRVGLREDEKVQLRFLSQIDKVRNGLWNMKMKLKDDIYVHIYIDADLLMTWSNNPPARLEYNSKSQKLDFIEP